MSPKDVRRGSIRTSTRNQAPTTTGGGSKRDPTAGTGFGVCCPPGTRFRQTAQRSNCLISWGGMDAVRRTFTSWCPRPVMRRSRRR